MDAVYETVVVNFNEDTATVTFNRPDSLNALNSVLIKELNEALKELSLNEAIKIVVLKGEGRAFSSGGDIKEMLQLSGKDQFFSIMEQINSLVTTVYTMPKLTIAAVNGAAAGLGLSLALAADYVICHEDSKLAMNFIGIGLVPDGGGHFHLERRIGEEKAKKLIWEGKVLNSNEAKKIDIIDEVAKDMNSAVQNQIKAWKTKPILAMIETKKIFTALNNQKLTTILELETNAQWKMRQTYDHQEGIKAFVEKRQPNFLGK
ncbi:enoyl-CoA hydratase [Heyndrickxia shackletonii]|uniref:Enoyl-CoA hydratase n=1 Tax=Heyndrickxia shackletonii TaxID=157838 RepID=A0A0Q3TM89_9BACI|nr:enoyl-CoA hydratase [Heyndrickxia shackletonii]KQL55088.1 enoyl-CoA hydratase [Heyndrickxia shackletonii]NEZ01362.1 enoyl-CoA hydratase [Heyndrickxia shackletonii]